MQPAFTFTSEAVTPAATRTVPFDLLLHQLFINHAAFDCCRTSILPI
jgi:hypothetical protein